MISRSQISKVLSVYRIEKGSPELTRSSGPLGKAAADTVKLSFSPGDLQRVREIAQRLPDIRMDRVRQVAGELASGTYKIDSREVAEKMLGRLLADRIK